MWNIFWILTPLRLCHLFYHICPVCWEKYPIFVLYFGKKCPIILYFWAILYLDTLGNPIPGQDVGYPIPRMGGYPIPRMRGYPSQVWLGGVPHHGGYPTLSGLDGVPHQDWRRYPHQDWMGVAPCPGLHGVQPPPPVRRQCSIASTRYGEGGMPLAFTQEDFLVSSNFYTFSFYSIQLVLALDLSRKSRGKFVSFWVYVNVCWLQ